MKEKEPLDYNFDEGKQPLKEPTNQLMEKFKERSKKPFYEEPKEIKTMESPEQKQIVKPKAPVSPEQQHAKKIKTGFNASELMRMKLPVPRWAIPDILPEGLNILAGKPKAGKSIIALNIAIAIATGGKALGKVNVEKGAVLYLALEDTKRRLQTRLQAMLQGAPAPENLYIETEWPKFDDDDRFSDNGLTKLNKRIKEISDLRLVIVDTLQKVRCPKKKRSNAYAADYEIGCQIKKLADKNNVSFLANHHLRKLESEDVFDDISGTLGLTGSADGTLVFKRKSGQPYGELHIVGRDMDRAEYGLKYHPEIWSWELLGDAAEIKSTENRQKIYDAIKNADKPVSTKEIESATGIKYQTVRAGLRALSNEQSIASPEYGKYKLANL